MTDRPRKNTISHYKRKVQNKCKRKNAIEAANSHMKYDYRILLNYIKSPIEDTVKLLHAVTAYNLKKWMRGSAMLDGLVMRMSKNIL